MLESQPMHGLDQRPILANDDHLVSAVADGSGHSIALSCEPPNSIVCG